MFSSSSEALKFIADQEIAMVDLKVTGIGGQWLHITVPARTFSQIFFESGVGYDGSSGAGFSPIECGDVCARPDPTTAFIDPFWDKPTISFICDTVSADTHEPLSTDPRSILQRAVAYMRSTGIADEAWMAPEFEFHVFDRVALVNNPYHTSIRVEYSEVAQEGGSVAIPTMGGYMRVPPSEQLHNLRTEMALTLEGMNIPVRYHHHEVGAAGQCEIEIDLDTLPRVADHTMIIKYVIKNIAHRHGKLATFMPKPVYDEPGNGMHVHQKLKKNGKPIFYDETEQNYANLSDTALHYIGGLLQHGAALTALTNPSTNSFKRLVEGYEAPVNLFFSLANRSAAIRIPKYAVTPQEKRIEFRPPDFTANIYIALAAMLMAGLDGIEKKFDLNKYSFGPFDVDITKQDDVFKSKIGALPRTLFYALSILKEDQDFLTKGEVLSSEFIQNWIVSKRKRDCDGVDHRPHPFEYQLYLDT